MGKKPCNCNLLPCIFLFYNVRLHSHLSPPYTVLLSTQILVFRDSHYLYTPSKLSPYPFGTTFTTTLHEVYWHPIQYRCRSSITFLNASITLNFIIYFLLLNPMVNSLQFLAHFPLDIHISQTLNIFSPPLHDLSCLCKQLSFFLLKETRHSLCLTLSILFPYNVSVTLSPIIMFLLFSILRPFLFNSFNSFNFHSTFLLSLPLFPLFLKQKKILSSICCSSYLFTPSLAPLFFKLIRYKAEITMGE